MDDSSVGQKETTNQDEIQPKMQFSGVVKKITLAGAVVDIGKERPGMLHISQIQVGENEQGVKRVEDALKEGQKVDVWVRRIKEGRIELTMIKPLAMDWRDLQKDMVVKGKVTRLEKFGAFVEIGAERPGLIHISEMAHGYVKTPSDVVKEGDEIEAKILEVNRRKKQIKLSMKALQPEPEVVEHETPAESQRKERPARRGKKGGKDSAADARQAMEEAAPAEPEPTYMEIVLRAAMEKAKEKKVSEAKMKKPKAVSKEQEDIITRTLENKVKTA